MSWSVCVEEASREVIPLQSKIINFMAPLSIPLTRGWEGWTESVPNRSIRLSFFLRSPKLAKFNGSGILIIKTPSICSISAMKSPSLADPSFSSREAKCAVKLSSISSSALRKTEVFGIRPKMWMREREPCLITRAIAMTIPKITPASTLQKIVAQKTTKRMTTSSYPWMFQKKRTSWGTSSNTVIPMIVVLKESTHSGR